MVERVAAFCDDEVKDTAKSPRIAVDGHSIIRVVFVFDAFGSLPLVMAVVLADTVRSRTMDFFTEAKVGDDEPITADGDQNIVWADVTMNVMFLVNEGQSAGQLVDAVQFQRNWTLVL